MKCLFPRLCLILVVYCSLAAPATVAQQQRCQPPVLPAAAKEPNIFTPQQETDLGDAIAEHVQRNFRLIDDEEAVGNLRRIGAALIKQISPTDLPFQFFLIDIPDANAFAMPGGRIYVSRKMVAFVRNEDELASVLAHEIGHLAARQTAADMTRVFKRVLGITQVGDRRDIFEKYNQLVENVARKPGAFDHREEEREQLEADQIGIYAMASAGYDPQAFAAFWDRFAETKGKTGSFLSDLFGKTNPDSRRLREILKGLQALPADCRVPRAVSSADEFQKWQAAVVSYSGTGRRESLHDVLTRKTLEPPLRGDINRLRFSPDGKYLLAQDDSGINVLTHEPFAPLFRIEAPEARQAQFSPDSQAIVFHSAALRVESWDIATQKPKSVREMYVREGCMQSELAPNGQTLACLDTNYALTLYDVGSGAQIFQKKDFFKPDFGDLFNMILIGIFRSSDVDLADFAPDIDWVSMRFSPDGRHFAAGQRSVNFTGLGVSNEVSAFVFDMNAKTTVPTKGQLKKMLSGRFDFLAPDRIIAVNPEDGRKSAIMSFPAGEVQEQFELGGKLEVVTQGKYVLLRPIRNYAVGIFDLLTKKIIMANKQAAFDIHGDEFVSERGNGEIGLYPVQGQGQQMKSKVLLPRNPLGRVRAAAVSPDFKWLAVSERSRGAVWDLTKGERVFHVRGFRGAHLGDEAILYADFPKLGDTERTVAHLNLSTHEATEGPNVEDTWRAAQYGPFILVRKPLKKGGDLSENISLVVQDARTGATLWTKDFPREAPRVWVDPVSQVLVMGWAVKADAAKTEIKADPKLGQKLAALKEKEGDYLLETFDARTGKQSGALLVETGKGSFRVSGVATADDLLILSDTENRVLVFSLSAGESKGKFFGASPVVSKASNLLAVENERGQLTIYDLASMAKRDQFTFSSPIKLVQFSPDGKRLFVLTAIQTAYILNLTQ